MAWLLGLGDRIVRGAGLFIALQVALLFGVLGVLVSRRDRVGWLAIPVYFMLLALPQISIWQGIVWKDVLFADFSIAGFTVLWLAHQDDRPLLSRFLLIGAFASLIAASLVRQNGVVMLLAAAGAEAYAMAAARPGPGWSRLLRPVAAAVLIVVICGAASVSINALLHQRSVDGDGSEAQIHMLQTYDVVGAVAHDPKLVLDDLDPPLEALIRSTAKDRYTPRGNDNLLHNAFDRTTGEGKAADALEAQWQDLLLHHPVLWLRHRLDVFGWVFFSPHAVCFTEQTGVDGPAAELKWLGLTAKQTPRDIALEAYSTALHGLPTYSHLFYALPAALLMVAMFRSRRRADAAFGFMLGGALLFVASFLLIGVSCDYRYLYALDLCTLVVGFHWVLDLKIGLPLLPHPDRSGPM